MNPWIALGIVTGLTYIACIVILRRLSTGRTKIPKNELKATKDTVKK